MVPKTKRTERNSHKQEEVTIEGEITRKRLLIFGVRLVDPLLKV
jgi:hypothetical protein